MATKTPKTPRAVTTRTSRVKAEPPQGATPATIAAVTATLAAAQKVFGTGEAEPGFPRSHADSEALQRAVRAEELLRLGTPGTRDGRRDSPRRLYWVGASAHATAAFDSWRFSINADRCADTAVDWRALRLDSRDGALFRAGGGGTPVTQHAIGQVLGVLGMPWSAARGTCADAPTLISSETLLAAVAKSRRGVADPVIVRTALWNGERVTRAIVTPRHALVHFDDVTLVGVLSREVPAHAEVAVQRGPLGCETRGWAMQRYTEHADLMTHWKNSETGEGRLSLRGGIRVRALDVQVVTPYGTTSRMVEVASTNAASERNHTLPTLGTEALALAHPKARIESGELLTEAQRRIIAEDRMADSYRQATEDARKLATKWSEAFSKFPLVDPKGHMLREGAEAILDMMEEQGLSAGEDRLALQRVLTDDTRLLALPRFSAAHVAAAYAVLAVSEVVEVEGEGETKKTTRSPRTWEDASRLQAMAGRWVMGGWDSREHAKLRGEE